MIPNNSPTFFSLFYYIGSTRKKDREYGVSRGIDFQNVSNVINFEFPKSVDAYIHRVGRYEGRNGDLSKQI